MSKYFLACCLLIVSFPLMANDWDGNLNFSWGIKTLNDSYFKDYQAEENTEVAARLDFGREDWPLHIALEKTTSTPRIAGEIIDAFFNSVNTEVKTDEYLLGIRIIGRPSKRLRPNIGGGIVKSTVKVTQDETTTGLREETDSNVGYWLSGGLYFTLGGFFNIGADLRYTSVEFDVFDMTVDAGGLTGNILMGIHW